MVEKSSNRGDTEETKGTKTHMGNDRTCVGNSKQLNLH
jgi:hypothetical protein